MISFSQQQYVISIDNCVVLCANYCRCSESFKSVKHTHSTAYISLPNKVGRILVPVLLRSLRYIDIHVTPESTRCERDDIISAFTMLAASSANVIYSAAALLQSRE